MPTQKVITAPDPAIVPVEGQSAGLICERPGIQRLVLLEPSRRNGGRADATGHALRFRWSSVSCRKRFFAPVAEIPGVRHAGDVRV
jgi:hypothetical protein